MAIQCIDVETLVQTHLDGELAEEDARALNHHLSGCSTCCDAAAEEARFHAGLRQTLAPPAMPANLRAKLTAELDREDWQQRKSKQGFASWALPGAATVAAAAALLLFAVANQSPGNEPALAHDAVRQHIRQPPIEVQGAAVTPWVKRHLSPGIEVPRFSDHKTVLRGARLSHVKGRDAALVYYDAFVGSRRHAVTSVIFEAGGIDLRIGQHHRIGGHELWVGQDGGYNVVTLEDPNGFGYIFISEMGANELLNFVVNSDLLLRAGPSWGPR